MTINGEVTTIADNRVTCMISRNVLLWLAEIESRDSMNKQTLPVMTHLAGRQYRTSTSGIIYMLLLVST